jgi:hypothetical protein
MGLPRSELVRLIEAALREQGGVVLTHLDDKRVAVSYDDSVSAGKAGPLGPIARVREAAKAAISSSESEGGAGVDSRPLIEAAVEEEVQREVLSHGDRMAFIKALEMEGTTLEQFRQRIRDEVTGRLGKSLERNAAGELVETNGIMSKAVQASAERVARLGGLVTTNVLLPSAWVKGIRFHGNTKFSDAELLRRISTKVGDLLDLRKVAMDVELIRKAYEQAGAKDAQVKYSWTTDDVSGRAHVTFEILVPSGQTK